MLRIGIGHGDPPPGTVQPFPQALPIPQPITRTLARGQARESQLGKVDTQRFPLCHPRVAPIDHLAHRHTGRHTATAAPLGHLANHFPIGHPQRPPSGLLDVEHGAASLERRFGLLE